jgi:hypothetical protein
MPDQAPESRAADDIAERLESPVDQILSNISDTLSEVGKQFGDAVAHDLDERTQSELPDATPPEQPEGDMQGTPIPEPPATDIPVPPEPEINPEAAKYQEGETLEDKHRQAAEQAGLVQA